MIKKFLIESVLSKVQTNKIMLSKRSCPEVSIKGYDLPARTATTKNQGLSCFVPRGEATILKDVISMSANGDFCAFWHDSEFTILQDSYALEGRGYVLSEGVALYLIGVMYKSLSDKYNWNNKSGWEKVKKEFICLPVRLGDSGNPVIDESCFYHPYGYIPDFAYMQERIAELEQERIAELEGYLKATGLDDYELTDEDRLVLEAFSGKQSESLKGVKEMREFKLVDIAQVEYGNKFDKNKMGYTSPCINFVSRTASNNGVSDYVDVYKGVVPYKAGAVTLALGGSIGSCFVQDSDFYTGQNVGVIILPSTVSRRAKIFFSEALGKKCRLSFTAFGNEINKHLKTDLSVSLPVLVDNYNNFIIDEDRRYHSDGYIPDWDFMERYIRAVEKVVIADAVKYKDGVIKTTKEVIGR